MTKKASKAAQNMLEKTAVSGELIARALKNSGRDLNGTAREIGRRIGKARKANQIGGSTPGYDTPLPQLKAQNEKRLELIRQSRKPVLPDHPNVEQRLRSITKDALKKKEQKRLRRETDHIKFYG